MKLGVLCSGNLGLQALFHLQKTRQIQFVCTDAGSVEIKEQCNRNDIPVFMGNPRGGRADSFLADKEIDVLVSVNYLFIIEPNLINLPKRLAINVHGSLLPKYRGRTPHVWAIINNEKVAGITAHIIDTDCDTGDILEQVQIPIAANDTGGSLLKKFGSLYPMVLDSVLAKLALNKITRIPQDNSRATYFGKRTPEDGLINWNWQRERIQNWVRAQCLPYPGAFTFYHSKKVIVDRIVFSDLGFHSNERNGMILAGGLNPIIKTPNGTIQLTDVRNEPIEFYKGELLSPC